MSRFRISMIAAAGVLVALTVGAIGSTALAGGRRGLHLPDHRWPAVPGLNGVDHPQQAHRGDRWIGPDGAGGCPRA